MYWMLIYNKILPNTIYVKAPMYFERTTKYFHYASKYSQFNQKYSQVPRYLKPIISKSTHNINQNILKGNLCQSSLNIPQHTPNIFI